MDTREQLTEIDTVRSVLSNLRRKSSLNVDARLVLSDRRARSVTSSRSARAVLKEACTERNSSSAISGSELSQIPVTVPSHSGSMHATRHLTKRRKRLPPRDCLSRPETSQEQATHPHRIPFPRSSSSRSDSSREWRESSRSAQPVGA